MNASTPPFLVAIQRSCSKFSGQKYQVIINFILLFGIFGSLGVYLFFSTMLFKNGLLHAFDTGIYLQIFENMRNYGDMASSITGEANFLAHHFQPILFFVYPFYLLYPGPSTLFALSAFAFAATVFILFKIFMTRVPMVLLLVFLMGVVWHPAPASRVFFCFVPEMLVLPFLTYQALLLLEEKKMNSRQLMMFGFCQLMAGMGKENIWLINGFVAFLLAWQRKEHRALFSGMMIVNIMVFCTLFFWWMPSHSQLSQYYGLSYYQHPWIQGKGIFNRSAALFLNIFSLRSLHTFVVFMIPLGGFFPFFNLNLALLGAIPGVLFILGSNHYLIHEPSNQYPLLYLPFIWVSGLIFIPVILKKESLRLIKILLPMLILIPPLLVTIPRMGVLLAKRQKYPYIEMIPAAMDRILKFGSMDASSSILIDGNLQPYVARYRNVYTLSEFTGNPFKKNQQILDTITDVITIFDPRSLESCYEVQKNPDSHDALDYDYQSFYEYCSWIRTETFHVTYDPEAKLFHFKRYRI
jgi:uncharacterized membrane protein